MKNTMMLGAAFIAGIAVVGGSFAFRGADLNEETVAAIETSDYAAFLASAPEKMIERVETEEEFHDMVARRAEKKALGEEAQAAILVAVQANDFAAFEAVHENIKAQKEALRPTDAPEQPARELTAEQEAQHAAKKQATFNELVAYYTENGELPAREEGRGKGMFGKRGGHHGEGDCEGKRERGEKIAE